MSIGDLLRYQCEYSFILTFTVYCKITIHLSRLTCLRKFLKVLVNLWGCSLKLLTTDYKKDLLRYPIFYDVILHDFIRRTRIKKGKKYQSLGPEKFGRNFGFLGKIRWFFLTHNGGSKLRSRSTPLQRSPVPVFGPHFVVVCRKLVVAKT